MTLPLRHVFALAFAARAASAQTPDGLFQTRCAGCHNAANAVGAPLPETLRQMPWRTILTALESGKMKAVGDAMDPADREAIAKYIGTSNSQSASASARCKTTVQSRPSSSDSNRPDWNGWSDAANTRFQPARVAG